MGERKDRKLEIAKTFCKEFLNDADFSLDDLKKPIFDKVWGMARDIMLLQDEVAGVRVASEDD